MRTALFSLILLCVPSLGIAFAHVDYRHNADFCTEQGSQPQQFSIDFSAYFSKASPPNANDGPRRDNNDEEYRFPSQPGITNDEALAMIDELLRPRTPDHTAPPTEQAPKIPHSGAQHKGLQNGGQRHRMAIGA